MAGTRPDSEQRCTHRGDSTTVLQTRERVLRGFLSSEMYDLEKDMPWHQRKALVGLSIQERDGSWRAVVKGRRHKKQWVAFVDGDTFNECLDHVLYCVGNEALRWFPDRYHHIQED